MNRDKSPPGLGYSDAVIEHFQNPRHVGKIEHADGVGRIINPVCGDVTELYLRIKSGIVEEARFQSLGCAVTIASASVFLDKIKGAAISELLAGEDEGVVCRLIELIEKELGELPAQKLHCPPATVEAFFQALEQNADKERDGELASRLKRLGLLVKEYYGRGKEKKGT